MRKVETLCLVDDDEIFTFLMRIIIEETNLVKKIQVFPNGVKALMFLEESLEGDVNDIPDIILLDVNMPVMGGWEFLEKYLLLLPRIPKKITIYVVSSSISYYDVEKARSITEVTDYIIKPITKQMIIKMIEAF